MKGLAILLLVVVIIGLLLTFFGVGASRGGKGRGEENLRQGHRDGGRRPGVAGPHGGKGRGQENLREERRSSPGPPYEYYKSIGLGDANEVKIELYPPRAYEEQLGGEEGVLGTGRFVAAARTYRWVEDGWHEMPLESAAQALDLRPEDYKVDGIRDLLLLREIPPGFPISEENLR